MQGETDGAIPLMLKKSNGIATLTGRGMIPRYGRSMQTSLSPSTVVR